MFERYATYIDLPDTVVFHQLVEEAKNLYLENAELFDDATDEDIKRWKQNSAPVIFASKVSKQTADDFSLLRPDMNDRAVRKYLILDADFKEGKEKSSNLLYNKLIDLAEELNTPLVIYPTASYPDKPRFRAVLFTKKSLNAAAYGQAMNWLYDKLEIPDPDYAKDPDIYDSLPTYQKDFYDAMDSSNKHIRSNNNAPFFTNEYQLDFIIDTTLDDKLTLLDNDLWKDAKKPIIPKLKTYGLTSELDQFRFDDDALEEACKEFAKSDFAQDYNTFWRFLHTLARAEETGTLTEEQVGKVLNWVADVPDKEKSLVWKLNNKSQYSIEQRRVLTNDDYFKKARPLVTYPEFKNVLLGSSITKID